MVTGAEFAPKWASPPGHTIRDAMAERGLGAEQVATLLEVSVSAVEDLIEGRCSITVATARGLSRCVGGSVEFWIARDGQYWDDLRRVEADAWARTLPVAEMQRRGWLTASGKGWAARARDCLGFFGVADVAEWRRRYEPMLTAAQYRATGRAQPRSGAVAAWLREAERRAAALPLGGWDQSALQEAVTQARRLSRQRDPRRFMPELSRSFASAGVAVVVVRAPSGCTASGAALRSQFGRRIVALSGKHLVDDHFWFTVMHEAGHLLLHDDDRTFVDDLDTSGPAGPTEEREADSFAAEVLLPDEARTQVPAGRIDARAVLRLSAAAGVAPGVVVGQLQHMGAVDYDRLNHLKRRYRWEGEALAAK